MSLVTAQAAPAACTACPQALPRRLTRSGVSTIVQQVCRESARGESGGAAEYRRQRNLMPALYSWHSILLEP